MSTMNKLVNAVAWVVLVLMSFGAASKVYVDWVMYTQINSVLILITSFALIFWGFFTIFNMLGIWTNKEGRK